MFLANIHQHINQPTLTYDLLGANMVRLTDIAKA